MNSDREPLSPPTSPMAGEDEDAEISDDEELLTPLDGSDEKEEDESDVDEDEEEEDDDQTRDVPSSPPTSIETPSKRGSNSAPSVQVSSPIEGPEAYRAPEVETEDEDDGGKHQQNYFPESERCEAAEDTFVPRGKVWESSSQWEDDEVEQAPNSSPSPNARQSPSSSRKSAPPLSSPLFPPRARQSQSSVSVKSHLSHRLYARPSPASRASSGSYDPRDHRDERKAPLVLLHITLLLLPGSEEIVLRHVTPTTFERGLLVEHPRGDYNLLEEMILDGLGLDDDDYPTEENTAQGEEEPSWERALNVPSTPGKRPWQLRVYASNGLMTPGAWKRVWSEMERIDVEIWPRGFDRTNKCRAGLSSPSSTIAAAMVRGGSSSGRATAVASPLPLELESSSFAAVDHGDIDGDQNTSLTNRNVRRDNRKNNSGGLPNHKKGNHNSGSGILRRLSQPSIPGSPNTNVSTPRSSRKSKHRSSSHFPLNQFSAANVKFYLNKLTTPKAVKILAGINLLLFLYFTLFKSFVGVASNTLSVTWSNLGGDDAICSSDDSVKVVGIMEPRPDDNVGIKIPDDVEEAEGDGGVELAGVTSDPDALDSLGEDPLPALDIGEDNGSGETENLEDFMEDSPPDDDQTPDQTFTAGQLSQEVDGDDDQTGEDQSTNKDHVDQFEFFMSAEDEEEENQKASAFPWSRWGDRWSF